MAEVRASDPATAQLRQVMAGWREAFNSEGVTVAQVIKRATEQARVGVLEGCKLEFVNEDLHEALVTVAGRGGSINSRALGAWLSTFKDRVADGQRFENRGTRDGVAVWALARS